MSDGENSEQTMKELSLEPTLSEQLQIQNARTKLAPGPSPQSLDEFQTSPLQFLLNAHLRYGDIVRIQMNSRIAHVISRPEWIRRILTNQHQYPVRSDLHPWLEPVMGNGLQRDTVSPAFHTKQINNFVATITACAFDWLGRLSINHGLGNTFDIAPEIEILTKNVFEQIMLGDSPGNDRDDVGNALKLITNHVAQGLLEFFPLQESEYPKLSQQMHHSIVQLNDVIYKLIKERRNATRLTSDLLAMLIKMQDPTLDETISDRQTRDAVVTLFIAGHQTTANALTWAIFLLCKTPDAYNRLKAEVSEVLNGRVPTLSDISKLTYSRMVIEEAIRLYPPSWALVRVARDDNKIGGYIVPAGSTVILSQYVVHRSPNYWKQPEVFDPNRFIGRRSSAYFPFGVGPRACIGSQLALLETTLVLAMIIQRYRLDLDPSHVVDPDPLITLRPRTGVCVMLQDTV